MTQNELWSQKGQGALPSFHPIVADEEYGIGPWFMWQEKGDVAAFTPPSKFSVLQCWVSTEAL